MSQTSTINSPDTIQTTLDLFVRESALLDSRTARVALVAIGRNEGDRLVRCLESARSAGCFVVYVDSGSTDHSLEASRKIAGAVIVLRTTRFTAARARNSGAAWIIQNMPGIEFIQFVDGDCELDPNWIQAASAFLDTTPRAAAVCGRRRERYPQATIYNQLCDIEWHTPIGRAQSCGGDAMIRVKAFADVGGYNPDVIAGEEPEMCFRMRHLGWEIHRIDAEMTLHDAAMTRLGQWWKRHVRAGHAFAEGNFRHGGPPEFFWRKNVRSNFFWGAPPMWIGWPLLWMKIYLKSCSPLQASFTTLSKLPQALGQLKFYWNRWRGRSQNIIEYK